jgi:hypothetical protein
MNNEDEFATRPLKDQMNRSKPGAQDQAPIDATDPTAKYFPSTAKVGEIDAQGIERTKQSSSVSRRASRWRKCIEPNILARAAASPQFTERSSVAQIR